MRSAFVDPSLFPEPLHFVIGWRPALPLAEARAIAAWCLHRFIGVRGMDGAPVARIEAPRMACLADHKQLAILLSIRSTCLNNGFLAANDSLKLATVSRCGHKVWWSWIS